MRKDFHPILLDCMRKDELIIVITADLGYKMFDAIKQEFPDRFYNVGAAEQCMLGVAIGLAEEGKIPVCYTISPFYWRAAEWIRNYVNHENVPVKMILGGRDKDYAEDGFTHDASDMEGFFSQFVHIESFFPTKETLARDTEEWIFSPYPAYISLKR